MKQLYALCLSLCLIGMSFTCFAQVGFNANTVVPPYTGNYLYGCNPGVYNNWNIYSIADIAGGNPSRNVPGVGVKTLHQPLPENFLDQWGYDIYLNVFAYYQRLGIHDNTVFLEFPSAAHQDNTVYSGCGTGSLLWKNMYLPIWDGGANGTPVNDDNYLALYVYNTVTRYKQWVKIWEIVNEPDQDNGVNGWRQPGDPGNWWDNNPTPCELTNMYAPVTNYIRALRIVYEVVKSIDPTAYVSMGGVGYPSFVDVLARNTDNPVDGTVTSSYPATGAAYFDCLSFHYYPMFDQSYVDQGVTKYVRYSDALAERYIARKNEFVSTLYKHGYNDTVYPKKIFICTENNIARKAFNPYVGGDDVQRNYDVKAAIYSQLNDIKQLYIFALGDNTDVASATSPWDVVGLYQNLNAQGPGPNATDTNGVYHQQYNNSGIAYKTFSDALLGFTADTAQTRAMSLPAAVRGGAFKNAIGDYRYVLWAATTTDNSEAASATYAFPAALNMPLQVYQHNWDYSQTQSSPLVSSQSVPLTGAPSVVFSPLVITALKPDSIQTTPDAFFSLNVYPNPVHDRLTVRLHLKRKEKVSIRITDGTGRILLRPADNTYYDAGNNLIYVPLPSSMANGMYYCRVTAGNTDQTIKFLVTKIK